MRGEHNGDSLLLRMVGMCKTVTVSSLGWWEGVHNGDILFFGRREGVHNGDILLLMDEKDVHNGGILLLGWEGCAQR